MLLTIVSLLAVLAVQGCLFGGKGGGEEAAGGGEAAPPGEKGEMAEVGAPAEAPGGDVMEGPEAAPGEAGGAGQDAASLVAAGMQAKHAGDLAGAQAKFEAAVAADPSNADAHHGLAWIYAHKKMKEKAITEFNKVKSLGADAAKVAEADKALERLSK